MKIVVEPGGGVRCLYGEAIDLRTFGIISIHRASHVEPDADGRWWSDLGPVAGPKLGPFTLRSEALAAEVEWLESNWVRHPI